MIETNTEEWSYTREEIAMAGNDILFPLARGKSLDFTSFVCDAFLVELLNRLEINRMEEIGRRKGGCKRI